MIDRIVISYLGPISLAIIAVVAVWAKLDGWG